METFREVTERLDRLEVPHMVTGSFAMGVCATARTTLDIDIIVEITQADIGRFVAAFAKDFYVQDSSILRAIEHHSMFNMISTTTSLKVDCIVRKDTAVEKTKFARRTRGRIGEHEFWAISRDDLILSKLAWARESLSERQFEDIDRLLETNADLNKILQEVDVQDLSGVWGRIYQVEDSEKEIRTLQHRVWLSLPIERRLTICAELYEIQREAALGRAPSGLSDEDRERFVFREFYGYERPF